MPELSINERVANACGVAVDDVFPHDKVAITVNGEHEWFDPEHDANDAVFAAEKFGLFDACQCHALKENGRWCIAQGILGVGYGTFCEAICQAILRLAESKAD